MTALHYDGGKSDFYVAAPAVAEMVNLAIELNRPLLVEGEPGCGKTQLAVSVAAELQLPLVKIVVKSTSRAQDLLYRMNGLRRLQDAQREGDPHARFTWPYLSLGLLGQAIQSRRRSVVLIDEIDKADIDFPNDLLDVLDGFSFQIDELPEDEEAASLARPAGLGPGFGRTVEGDPDARPIVVVTSNREKRLPEPFLRRCLYVNVAFPDDEATLREIVRRNAGRPAGEIADEVLNAAVAAFLRVRALAVKRTQKPPTTSELIDWVRIVHARRVGADALEAAGSLPPYWTLLFKTLADLDAYRALADAKP